MRIGIFREDPSDQFALLRRTWLDRFFLDGGSLLIEAQFSLTIRGVWAVASEAVVREDRSDISVVIQRDLGLGIVGLPGFGSQENC